VTPAGPDPLGRARAASAERRWLEAISAYRKASNSGIALTGEDLSAWGYAAYWSRDVDQAIDRLESASDALVAEGDSTAAAETLLLALQIAAWGARRGRVVALNARLTSLLEATPTASPHAIYEWALAWMIEDHDIERCGEMAESALEMARTVDSRAAEALCLTLLSRVDVHRGDMAEALRKVDAAVALALGEGVHDIIAGGVFCGVIWTCRNAGYWDRASEWTDVAAAWADRARVSMFPGICQVHRCEILRVRGDLDLAEEQVERAIGEFDDVAPSPKLLGSSWHELGRIRLMRGDHSGASEAFAICAGLGHIPEPGLALLQLARGRPQSAREQLEPLVQGPRLARERAFVLPVLIEACIELGDLDAARAHLGDLHEIAQRCRSDSHVGSHALAAARIGLAAGELSEARSHARTATTLLGATGDPHQIAVAHEVAGRIELARDEPDAAEFAFAASTAAYERVGAVVDAERVRRLQRPDTPPIFERRAFVFTDIVDSTKLHVALGDQRWLGVLEAHDLLHIAAIEQHDGQVVKHEGDGFFASFPSSDHALRAACGIQRSLAEQRRETGFSLDVRIGIHEGEAASRNGDWFGIAVTTAARVAAAAGPGEVLCTSAVRASASAPDVTGERSIEAKGLAEAITVHVIAGCD